MKRAVLLVERNFISNHVGVRRVTFWWRRQLEEAGFQVSFAAPMKDELVLLNRADIARGLERFEQSQSDMPTWVGEGEIKLSREWRRPEASSRPPRFERAIRLADFDFSVATCPWLFVGAKVRERFSVGIVHDLVPNLMASGVLSFGKVTAIHEFAHAHDVGYQVYLNQAERIVAGSQSACADFIDFYRMPESDADRIRQVLPYTPPTPRPRRIKARSEPTHILLVNILDHRKNPFAAAAAVSKIASDRPLVVDVVGAPRMESQAVLRFLQDLSASCTQIRWHRMASDRHLSRLYAEADALVFPSFYEGLGFPILEAQAAGTPAATSSTSSCGEINLNTTLAADPHDVDALEKAVRLCVAGACGILRGNELVQSVSEFAAARNRLEVLDLPHLSGAFEASTLQDREAVA